MTSTTNTTSTTTTCPVTSVTYIGAGTITTGLSNISLNNLGSGTESLGLSEHYLNTFDIAEKVFAQCLSKDDLTGIAALACTNKTISENIESLASRINLIQLCPGLTILDAEIQGFEVDDEPSLNNLAALICYRKFASHVENNAGLTILTVPKGLTPNWLIADAKKAGIEVDILWRNKILMRLGEAAVKDTYRIMITNAPVTETRDKNYGAQEKRVCEAGFDEMPKFEEYLLLLISTQKITNFANCLYGRDPWTYGRSPTKIDGIPLSVGGSAPGCLRVRISHYFGAEYDGVGGRRKF
jgi:hypothetical protein